LSDLEHIQVAAAVIINPWQQILLSLRNPKAHQGGKWEFPGGKTEVGETSLEALFRELKEELNIDVLKASEYLRLEHQYPEKKVTLAVYLVSEFSGTPQGMEGQDVQWFDLTDLQNLQFPDANYAILEKLMNDFHPRD